MKFQNAITETFQVMKLHRPDKAPRQLSKRNKAIKTLKAPNRNNVNRPISQSASLYANATHKSDPLSAVKKVATYECVRFSLFVHPEAPETGSTVIILVVASGFDKKARDDRNPISLSFFSALGNKSVFIVVSLWKKVEAYRRLLFD